MDTYEIISANGRHTVYITSNGVTYSTGHSYTDYARAAAYLNRCTALAAKPRRPIF